MLFAAEFYTPSGHFKDAYTEGSDAPLTPVEVLRRCLNTHLPEIFETKVAWGTGACAYVGLALPLLSTGGLQAGVSMVWRAESFTGALELWRPDASGGLRLSNVFSARNVPTPPPLRASAGKRRLMCSRACPALLSTRTNR